MFFGDRPRFAPYEIQHCLPTHEHVYQASSASEFSSKFVQTNQTPFPDVLNAVLSPFEEFPKDVSAAGHFMLLHGKASRILANWQAFMRLSGPNNTIPCRILIYLGTSDMT
jgi:hypothetical protein